MMYWDGSFLLSFFPSFFVFYPFFFFFCSESMSEDTDWRGLEGIESER